MYPRVAGEFDTVRRLLKGKSIARFGDGELKILSGAGYTREPVNGHLTAEMRMLVAVPHDDCIIGIPTMDPAGPKYQNWLRHKERFCKYFEKGDGHRYGSAFITRPDSAADPIESAEYFGLLSRLWAGRPQVVVLCEPSNKILTCVRAMAASYVHIECPSYRAYDRIDEFEQAIVDLEPSVALLSCGPTATCLANRLPARGVQAIDMGSIGGMLMRLMPREVKACD